MRLSRVGSSASKACCCPALIEPQRAISSRLRKQPTQIFSRGWMKQVLSQGLAGLDVITRRTAIEDIQAVQHPLQDIAGGNLIDDFRAPGA